MSTRRELKDAAKQSLRGNWGWAVIVFLINAIITWAFDSEWSSY